MRAIVFSVAALAAIAQAVAGTPKKVKPATCFDLGITHSYTSNWGEVTLAQHGCKVSGTYRDSDGTIEGTLEGNMLRYTWTQSDSSGRGVFVVATNGELVGTWGTSDDEVDGGGWRLTPADAIANP
jgi:hypothetical protein